MSQAVDGLGAALEQVERTGFRQRNPELLAGFDLAGCHQDGILFLEPVEFVAGRVVRDRGAGRILRLQPNGKAVIQHNRPIAGGAAVAIAHRDAAVGLKLERTRCGPENRGVDADSRIDINACAIRECLSCSVRHPGRNPVIPGLRGVEFIGETAGRGIRAQRRLRNEIAPLRHRQQHARPRHRMSGIAFQTAAYRHLVAGEEELLLLVEAERIGRLDKFVDREPGRHDLIVRAGRVNRQGEFAAAKPCRDHEFARNGAEAVRFILLRCNGIVLTVHQQRLELFRGHHLISRIRVAFEENGLEAERIARMISAAVAIDAAVLVAGKVLLRVAIIAGIEAHLSGIARTLCHPDLQIGALVAQHFLQRFRQQGEIRFGGIFRRGNFLLGFRNMKGQRTGQGLAALIIRHIGAPAAGILAKGQRQRMLRIARLVGMRTAFDGKTIFAVIEGRNGDGNGIDSIKTAGGILEIPALERLLAILPAQRQAGGFEIAEMDDGPAAGDRDGEILARQGLAKPLDGGAALCDQRFVALVGQALLFEFLAAGIESLIGCGGRVILV